MKGFVKFLSLILILLVIISVLYMGGKKMIKLPWDNKESVEAEATLDSAQNPQEETTTPKPDLNIETPTKSETTDDSSETNNSTQTTKTAEDPSQTQAIETIKTADDSWALILANPSNPVPQDWAVNVEHLQNNKEVDTRVLPFAKEMMAAAQADGIDLFIVSAYRSVSYQQGLFDRSLENYKAQGYSDEEALTRTKQYYSVPGYSEHHTGLALDIVTPDYQMLNDGYADTDAAKWLVEHAHEYGFILRYPKDKEDITQINFEPWHYRYVGVDHASYMKEHNLCLEEYLEQR